jgi:hypothetical protein
VLAGHWIDFAYGKDPWPLYGESSYWMRYGPDDGFNVVSEAEDESVRKYAILQKIIGMGILDSLFEAADDIAVKRFRMGMFEWKPQAIDYEIR